MAVSMKVLTVLQFISIFTIYTGRFIAFWVHAPARAG